MPKVKLADIVDAIEMQFDQTHSFLDRQTGKVVALTDDELAAADDGDDPSDYPEWQREMIVQAQAVQADDAGRFLGLPDSFEINEWDMMRDFAAGIEGESISKRLLNAIHGTGAFRCFKDRIHEENVAKDWYAFREERYRQVALDWCEANGLEADAGE
ncbi:MAG TPA: UPF0158 family protein [Phycisphaerae bacterium]|nr:UPF0158 family protein [Phycisphaerae bacterium]